MLSRSRPLWGQARRSRKGRWAARRGPCGRCRAGTARAGRGRRTDGGAAAVVRQCGLCLDWGVSRLWYGLCWSCHGWLENRGTAQCPRCCRVGVGAVDGGGLCRPYVIAVREETRAGTEAVFPGPTQLHVHVLGLGQQGARNPTVPPLAGRSPAPSSTRPSQAQRPDVHERRQALRPPCNPEQATAPNGRPAAVPAAPPCPTSACGYPRCASLTGHWLAVVLAARLTVPCAGPAAAASRRPGLCEGMHR
jgi:hypothetical protein